jgi:hypothetical protein
MDETLDTTRNKADKSATSRVRNRGGRPAKKIKKAIGIRVRVTATERFMIETKARKANMRISDWFRSAALKATVIARLSTEDRQYHQVLAGMANNLNQLTKLAHVKGLMSIVMKCDALLTEIDQILKRLVSDDREDT